jgi:release factor glutamine methyltransferase
MSKTNIQELLSKGTALLASKNISTPDIDAALLLAHATSLSREKLYARADKEVSDEQRDLFYALLERRQNGECIAYITGHKEFWGLDFTVTPVCLVPRPETEILVETTLAALCFSQQASVLDICTGCGAIAIALKHQYPALDVWAADISKNALDLARLNAERLGAAITFVQGDLFEAVVQSSGTDANHGLVPRFDLITANAPYIASGLIDGLAAEVRHEPRIALDGGSGGLDIIRRIIEGAPLYLKNEGSLILEADPQQMEDITMLMRSKGFKKITVVPDLSGNNRIIKGNLVNVS